MAVLTRKEQKERLAILDARAAARDAGHDNARASIHAAGGLASNMTLRDHFAGQALGSIQAISYADTMAIIAYRMADAMLEARKTTGEGE